jgi:hypothetical protein
MVYETTVRASPTPTAYMPPEMAYALPNSNAKEMEG